VDPGRDGGSNGGENGRSRGNVGRARSTRVAHQWIMNE